MVTALVVAILFLCSSITATEIEKCLEMNTTAKATFAVGNQAGDADSIVSAIAASFYMNEVAGTDCSPLVSFPRKDFRLRGDAKLLFELAGWPMGGDGTPQSLRFLDEAERLDEVVLTDANTVGPHIAQHDPKVIAVFDHHQDEKQFMDASPRLIDESAGSACSVVSRAIYDKPDAAARLSKELAVLLFGTILLDTRDFKEKRHNKEDERIFARICERVPHDLVRDKHAVYKRLMDARNDVSHLTVGDLLRLDYKQADEQEEAIGFSTVFTTAPDLFAPERNVLNFMAEMVDEKELSALIAITSGEKDTGRRGLVVCSNKPKLADDIVDGLKADPKKVFSSSFLNLPLAISQKIVERGFALEPHPMDTAGEPGKLPRNIAHFSTWTVPGSITRKTLLPAVMELVARSKRL
jgi:inorganic pyrophosphatase/exopolyphosphatase